MTQEEQKKNTSTNTTQAPPASTGGTQVPPASYSAAKNTGFSLPPLQAPTAQQAFQQSFPRPNNSIQQSTNQAIGQPLQPRAQTAFKNAFPTPTDTIAQNANNAVQVPKMEMPEPPQKVGDMPDMPGVWSPDSFKDGSADGLARNFLKGFNTPKVRTEESQNETTKRILALGNALRHIGNIVNTSKGGPVQIYNDPVALAEQQYQTKRAQRIADEQRKENAAYKQAQMDYQKGKLEGDQAMRDFKIKLGLGNADRAERKLAADKAYKDALLKIQQQGADGLAAARKANTELQGKRFEEAKRHNRVSEAQGAERVNIARYNATHKGSGGSGGGGGKKPYGKFLGQWYSTKAEYDKAVLDYAQRNGIHTTYKKKHYDINGDEDSSNETGRPISSIAAEGERHYAKNARIRRLHGGK